jgi:hypothetical protein
MTDSLTKLRELEALSEKATPGPWSLGGIFMPDTPKAQQSIWGLAPSGMQSGKWISSDTWQADAALIVAAVNFVRTELKELVGRAVLEEHLMLCAVCDSGDESVRCERGAELEAVIGKPAGKDFIPPSNE